MQSIITRYRGPTATGAAKIIAKATGGIRRSYSLDHARTDDQQHMDAAKRLIAELDWQGRWHGGAYDDQGSWIWVREWHDSRDSFGAHKIKPVELSECCHAELTSGPYDSCICTNCSMEEPKVWDGKSPPWPRSEREGGAELPDGVNEPEGVST